MCFDHQMASGVMNPEWTTRSAGFLSCSRCSQGRFYKILMAATRCFGILKYPGLIPYVLSLAVGYTSFGQGKNAERRSQDGDSDLLQQQSAPAFRV